MILYFLLISSTNSLYSCNQVTKYFSHFTTQRIIQTHKTQSYIENHTSTHKKCLFVNPRKLDDYVTTYIITHNLKHKIFIELANQSDMLQTFDSFNPLYIILLLCSAFSFDDTKRHKINKLRKNNPKSLYRWVDISIIVIIITLMRNVKNAI